MTKDLIKFIAALLNMCLTVVALIFAIVEGSALIAVLCGVAAVVANVQFLLDE